MDVFILAGETMGRVGLKRMSQIFLFVLLHVVFTVDTKALGEEVLEGAENCFIWRLRIPFNHEPSPRNYLQKLLNYENLLEAENSVSHSRGILSKMYRVFYQRCGARDLQYDQSGKHNHKPGHRMDDQGRTTDKKFKFFNSEEEFMTKAAIAPRSNCVLDTTKAEKAGIAMRPVEEAMIDSIRRMRLELRA